MTLSSPLVQAIERLRNAPLAARPLTPREQEQLERQGNLIDSGATLLAGTSFDAGSIHQCRLKGRVVLDGQAFRSVLEDVELSPDCQVDQCALLRRVFVGRGALVRSSSIDCSIPTSFGMGAYFKAGLETPGKEIPLWDSMTLASAENYLVDSRLRSVIASHLAEFSFTMSIVEDHAQIVASPWLDGVYLGSHGAIRSASKVVRSTIHSSAEEPTSLGANVVVEDSLIQWGCRVDSGAQIRNSALLEHSGAQRMALVTESLLGPNTEVGEAEVTASFLGPFVGLHHHSLVIATWWPEGRGNVGYGANVGSNHTSRAPDQELWAGEGTFFGLSTAIKFPSNFHDAPYSIVATGVTTLPQRLAMPFSLILDEPAEDSGYGGLNRLIPAWVLSDNVYLLLRSESKYRERDHARRNQLDLRIFRPEIVEKMWKARDLLASISGKPVYNKSDLAALGSNYLIEADRARAIQVYEQFLAYSALRLAFEDATGEFPCDQLWLDNLFHRAGLGHRLPGGNIQQYLQSELQLWASARESKARDQRRGSAIIPDYERVHGSVDDDKFLRRRREWLEQLAQKNQQNGS